MSLAHTQTAKSSQPSNLSIILSGPISKTLLRLAAPNIISFLVQAGVTMMEMWFVGLLGTSALAGLALAYPMAMLMNMLSAGSIGGVIAATTARAIGAKDMVTANRIIWHGIGIALGASALFSFVFLSFGERIYALIGGQDENLKQAISYSNALFTGVIFIWLFNTFSSLIRGSGDMKTPARALMIMSVVQVVASGVLSQGFGPIPSLGIAGIAWGMVLGGAVGFTIVFIRLLSGKAGIQLTLRACRFDKSIAKDLLKVGSIAAANPVLSISSIVMITYLVSRFGEDALAGFGIGSRVEFILVPIVFGFGAAMISMVGSNVGAGQVPRAERIAWTGGAMSAGVCGAIGVIVAVFPLAWAGLFTSEPAVLQAASDYLQIAGPSYAFFGLGLSLYFASQGAHAVLWPVLASAGRLVVAVGIGAWAVSVWPDYHTVLYCIAASLAIYGVGPSLALFLGVWRKVNGYKEGA